MGYEDGSYPGYRDLTPGEFRQNTEKIEVKTDSLLSCGDSIMKLSNVLNVNAAAPLAFAKADYGKDAGSRAIGNDPDFYETYHLANRLTSQYGMAAQIERVTQDLTFGNLALANVAMGMAMKYGATDGFNAVNIAGAVDDAFAPPSNTAGGTLSDMYQEQNQRRLDANEQAHLPRVHPSDVKFYLMSGQRPGEDFIIEDTSTQPFADNPDSDGDFSNGETVTPPEVEGGDDNGGNGGNGGGDSNPYYEFSEEDDYDMSPESYQPPANPHEDQTLAPGPNYGNGNGPLSGPSVV